MKFVTQGIDGVWVPVLLLSVLFDPLCSLQIQREGADEEREEPGEVQAGGFEFQGCAKKKAFSDCLYDIGHTSKCRCMLFTIRWCCVSELG